MAGLRPCILIAPLLLAACGDTSAPTNQTQIKVRSAEQDALHKLNAMNLAIALKRAITAAGYTCRRVTAAGFVGPHENLDMWTASCDDKREWAIFAGPDGSAQVRVCEDVLEAGLPQCKISKRPEGRIDSLEGSPGDNAATTAATSNSAS